MKKAIIFFLCAIFILSGACSKASRKASGVTLTPTRPVLSGDTVAQYSFKRDISTVDYSNVGFTPWDIRTSAAQFSNSEQSVKPYTIMIYMNGSDLESENGAASDDINEILASGVDTGLINVIVFTGGAYRWQKKEIPSGECALWQLDNRQLSKIADLGALNMSDPGTLSCFISFGLRNFPAEKYGLIFWDHGGGSIAGYGYDEIYGDSATLLKLDYAFMTSGLGEEQKLDFLGFDACLMATAEMAVIASSFAKYLIASEDLEPGDGWDYRFLAELNTDSSMDGAELGAIVVDYFMRYYETHTDESLTLSVTDLSNAGIIMGAMGALMEACRELLTSEGEDAMLELAARRENTRTFGEGSARDNNCDMVDIGDMAVKLSDLFPDETSGLLNALSSGVIYNRNNSDIYLGGLSSYYIYGGKAYADYTLKVYSSLKMSLEYTEYLQLFAKGLNSNDTLSLSTRPDLDSNDKRTNSLLPAPVRKNAAYTVLWKPLSESGCYYMAGISDFVNYSGKWPVINGEPVFMEEIERRGTLRKYAIASKINGYDADIIVLINKEYPNGIILGTRRQDGFVIQKGLNKIKAGDKIAFYYRVKDFNKNSSEENEWYTGPEVEMSNTENKLEWRKIQSSYFGILIIDSALNKVYTEPQAH